MKKAFFILVLALTLFFAFATLDKRRNVGNDHTHTYGDWETIEEPTCTKNGMRVRTCSCLEQESKTVFAFGHSAGEWVVDEKATCTEMGTRHYVCTVCNTLVNEKYSDLTAHNYTAPWMAIDDTYHVRICQNSDCAAMSEKVPHTWGDDDNCTACHATKGLQFKLLSDGTYEISGCMESASTVNIPSTYNGVAVTSIGEKAFSGCTSLTSITIPNSVISIGNSAFAYCSGLTSVVIPSGVTSISEDAFNGCSNLTSVTIPDSVTGIGRNAFYECTSLASITIPDCVTSIGTNAFYRCSSLTSITIPTGVTRIGNYVFAYCSGLTSITIPDCVTSIGASAFYCCSGLTSVTFSTGVTRIGDSAFAYCDNLTSIVIPEKVTSIGGAAFEYCSSLASITIPTSVKSIGEKAFYHCPSLASITFGANSKLTNVGDDAFLETAYYNDPANWENGVLYIGNHLVKAQSLLSEAYVVRAGALTIFNCAFEGCDSLASITIPTSVTDIGEDVFLDCIGLTSITFDGTKAQWENIAKGDSWNFGIATITVICTDGTITETYSE